MKIATKRPNIDKIRAMAVKKTAQVFDVTESYVRMIIKGDREHETINREYNKTYKSIKKLLTA